MKKQLKTQTAARPEITRDVAELRETSVATRSVKSKSPTPTADQIRARAFEIYQQKGCVPGHDLEHWLQAEHELRKN